MEAAASDSSNVVPLRAKREGTPNPVWDTCVEVLGYEPATITEKALWGKMTTSLTRAEATAEKIKLVAEWYHRRWPDIDLTITAIEKWYSHFLAMATEKERKKAKADANICPECEMGGGHHVAGCAKSTGLS